MSCIASHYDVHKHKLLPIHYVHFVGDKYNVFELFKRLHIMLSTLFYGYAEIGIFMPSQLRQYYLVIF